MRSLIKIMINPFGGKSQFEQVEKSKLNEKRDKTHKYFFSLMKKTPPLGSSKCAHKFGFPLGGPDLSGEPQKLVVDAPVR